MYHYFRCDRDTAVVDTDKGKVQGYKWDDVCIFKGIPYATARRFHKAEETASWEGAKDATNYGCVCPLLRTQKPNGELGVPHRYWIADEDCLNLNIWTPGCDGNKRPVLVWFHGGGYSEGSAIEQEAYDGQSLCSRGDVVVVSVNHRINILGYFDLSSFGEEYSHSANNGTLDLVMALKWVQRNIAGFGGDPDNVTIFGQSGGGGKVAALMQTPAADGLYHKAVMMSGTVTNELLSSDSCEEQIVSEMMEYLGLQSAKELEDIPYTQLAEAYQSAPSAKAGMGGMGQAPKKNADFCGFADETPMREETAEIPVMIGTVYGEFSGFVPPDVDRSRLTDEEAVNIVKRELGENEAKELIPLFRRAYPERSIYDMLCLDAMFRPGTQFFVKERGKMGARTYSYLFNKDMNKDFGAVPGHCSDIPYFFGNTRLSPTTQQEGVEELEEKIMSALLSFARTGCPENEEIGSWPSSTAYEEYCMILDDCCEVRVNHDRELMPLYKKYIVPYTEKVFAVMMENMQH